MIQLVKIYWKSCLIIFKRVSFSNNWKKLMKLKSQSVHKWIPRVNLFMQPNKHLIFQNISLKFFTYFW